MDGATGNIFFFGWELRLMEWLQGLFGDKLGAAIGYLSILGEGVFIVFIVGIFYWGIDKEMGEYLGRNILIGSTWSPMIKNVFLRRRPYFDDPKLKILRIIDKDGDIYDTVSQGFSFPSSHSTASVTMYGALPLYKGSTASRYDKLKKIFIIAAFAFPFMVGFSRVIVGAHYPTDVLAGWTLGTFVILLIPRIYDRIGNDFIFAAIIIAVSLPGFFYCRSNDYFTCLGLLVGFLISTALERKYVQFENTSRISVIILRIVFGMGIFLALQVLLKLPFSKEFLETGSLGSHFVRFMRYAIIAFVVFFIYPMFFDMSRIKNHFNKKMR